MTTRTQPWRSGETRALPISFLGEEDGAEVFAPALPRSNLTGIFAALALVALSLALLATAVFGSPFIALAATLVVAGLLATWATVAMLAWTHERAPDTEVEA